MVAHLVEVQVVALAREPVVARPRGVVTVLRLNRLPRLLRRTPAHPSARCWSWWRRPRPCRRRSRSAAAIPRTSGVWPPLRTDAGQPFFSRSPPRRKYAATLPVPPTTMSGLRHPRGRPPPRERRHARGLLPLPRWWPCRVEHERRVERRHDFSLAVAVQVGETGRGEPAGLPAGDRRTKCGRRTGSVPP